MKIIKKGMTLNEIMLAVVILAVAFIPIVGVISSSMKATEKDEHIIKAMQLCQEKLNIALQFPFEFFSPTNNPFDSTFESPNVNGRLSLVLGDQQIKSITYNSTMTVATETVRFSVPVVDFSRKPHDSCNNPSSWINTETVIVNDMVKRYTVTVRWQEPGDNPASRQKFYTLSVLKANVQR